MQSMVEILIHAAFITSILLQPIASSDDIIFYDEFLFHFDLLNENDWDQYHVQNNKPQETQNTFDYHGRRLIGQHNQHNDNDNQYASKCTNRIPVIFKHLCVHWDLINGFTFNYRSTLPQSTQNNYQTNWFYPSRSAKISSAKNAAKYYNILDGETWSMSDDKSWNEIDWISSLNHETPSDDVFKQCRTNKAIEECAHYDLHHKKLTFAIKVPKGRYKRHTPSHHLSSPANIESFAAFAPQSIAMPFDIGSLGIDSNALFPPRGDFESIKGPMDGLDMSNMNAPPFADNQVFTNDLRDETASRMMQMIGFNDPMNVRRRMYEDDGIYYEKYFYHWPPRAVVFGPAQQSRSASNAFAPPITGAVGSHGGMASGVGAMFGMAIPGSSSTIDMNEIGKLTNLEDSNPDLTIQSAEQMMKWTGHDDPWNIRRRLYGEDGEDAMTYDYMDDIQNGYDFTAPFEYGDMLGYRLWAKDRMAVDEFECLNCDEENVFGAHAMDDETEIEASDYSLYGDFMYYFDEHLFDFANDEDWKSNNGDLSKCSVAIPGLHHKVCVDHDNDKYQIRFGAASDTARRRLRNHGYGDEYNDYLDSQQEMHDLGNILLDWEDNTDWNEISDVSDHNDALGDTQHSIRKCKTQQSVQICGTMRDNNMKVSVKVGRHKYHRSSAHQEMKNAQFDYDLKLDNAAANTVQDMHWMVDHNVMNIDDKQWNDPRQFRTSHHYTYHKHHIMRRCKGTFCLCQYVDNAMDNVIHPCKPAFKADTNSIFGPKHLVNLADVMDSFVAPVHILRVMQPIRPITHRLPYVHILMLKANEHTKHKPLIQWHRYKPFARYIPPSKPQWLPPWMWYAVKQNLQPSGHNSILSSFITDQSVQSTRRRLPTRKTKPKRKRAKSHGPRTRPKPKAKPKATPNAKPQAASVAAKPKAKPKAAPPKTKTKTETKAVGKPVSSGTKAETKAAPPAAPKAGEPVASTKEKAAGLLSRAQGLSDQHGGLAGMADTFNQVASVAKTAGIEVPTTDDMAATIADKATAAVAQHTGLDPTQVQALGNVASTVGEQVARQQMAAAPPESSTASEPAPPVTPSVPDAGSTASPQTPQTPVTPPAKTALATPVTPPVTGQVTGSNPALMTAVGTTGVQSPPAVLSTPPTTPVTAATPMMPLGSAPLPATQALPPVTPRYGLPPVSPIGTESRTAIGLLVAHVPMPQGFQSSQPPLMRAHTMVNNYHQYYDYEDDIDDQILDGWYDQYDENEWVVMDDADNGDVVDTLDLLDFEDDSIWDEIMMNIETLKGNSLDKKCMKIFGRKLCLCEFIDWVNGKEIGGNTKHVCYPSAHKPSAVTKKTMKQIQTAVLEKALQKEKKEIKEEERNNVLKRINAEPNRIPLNTKRNDKQIKTHKVKVDKMAQQKVEKGHSQIMKRLSPSAPTRSHVHTHSGLPAMRPVWLPHYFWHWLHHFKRSKRLHSNDRIPWISSAADVNGDVRQMYDEYETYDDAYDAYIEAAANYWKAYVEYNEAVNEYDETMNENDEVFLYDADDENINYNEQNEYNQYEYEHQNAYTEADDNTYEFDKSYNLYSYATDGSD
eukprot:482272_1